jgi:oxygen-independent coproporphyrinogen-3 oxidase
MFGTGVASFGHANGVHMQNVDSWEQYTAMLKRGELPLGRALPIGPRQQLIREMILQLKTGRLATAYFADKFGVDIRRDFAGSFERLAQDGNLEFHNGTMGLTRAGLLQVDRLLPEFFEPEHRGGRYT